jgi:hypothetical protein
LRNLFLCPHAILVVLVFANGWRHHANRVQRTAGPQWPIASHSARSAISSR